MKLKKYKYDYFVYKYCYALLSFFFFGVLLLLNHRTVVFFNSGDKYFCQSNKSFSNVFVLFFSVCLLPLKLP